MAPLLEREQPVPHLGGGRARSVALGLVSLDQGRERFVERHRAQLQARVVGLDARHGTREVDDRGAAAPPLEEPQGALDLGAPHRMPPAAEADERLLRRRELEQLLLGQLDVADRDAPVEARERLAAERPARASRRRRDEVQADTALSCHPLARKKDRHAQLLEPGHRVAEQRPHLVGLERRPGHVVVERGHARVSQNGLDRRTVLPDRLPRISVTEEIEDALVTVR